MAKHPDTAAPNGQPEAPRLRRRWLVNLALLAIVATLAVFTVYHRQQEKTELGAPLAVLATENVGRIRIERPGQPAIVLEKETENWRLVSPMAARANRFNVENLLRVASARSELKFDGGDPARHGLITPQAKLEVGDETFEFGALHPFRHQVYVRHRGVVHLVGAQALSAVLRAPSHFIDGRLIEPNRRLVGLRLPGFALELKDGAWQRLPPNKKLASDRLNDFVAQWTNAHALAVEAAGNRPALARVHLTLASANAKPQHTEVLPAVPRDAKPESLTLDVLAYKPTFVLRRRDEKLEYHFPEEIGKRLLDIGND